MDACEYLAPLIHHLKSNGLQILQVMLPERSLLLMGQRCGDPRCERKLDGGHEIYGVPCAPIVSPELANTNCIVVLFTKSLPRNYVVRSEVHVLVTTPETYRMDLKHELKHGLTPIKEVMLGRFVSDRIGDYDE